MSRTTTPGKIGRLTQLLKSQSETDTQRGYLRNTQIHRDTYRRSLTSIFYKQADKKAGKAIGLPLQVILKACQKTSA